MDWDLLRVDPEFVRFFLVPTISATVAGFAAGALAKRLDDAHRFALGGATAVPVFVLVMWFYGLPSAEFRGGPAFVFLLALVGGLLAYLRVVRDYTRRRDVVREARGLPAWAMGLGVVFALACVVILIANLTR